MKKRSILRRFFLCLTAFMLLSTLTACGRVKIYNNHTLHTSTAFSFTEDGKACIAVGYVGYHSTKGASIHVSIEKHSFLFFYREIVSQTYTAVGESYQNEFFYPIDGEGAYRCTVTYTVSGSGGADDTIVFKDIKDYAIVSESTAESTESAAPSSAESTSAEDTATVYPPATVPSFSEMTAETTASQPTAQTETTAESTSVSQRPETPLPSASEFADMLAFEIGGKNVSATRFHIDKSVTIGGAVYDTRIRYMSVFYDLRERSAPVYSYFITAYSQTEQYENFYNYLDGTLYISINGDRLQKPLSAEAFLAQIPPHPLAILFEKRNYREFENATLTRAENGSVTALITVPFADYYEEMLAVIDHLTNDDVQAYPPQTYDTPVKISVTLDENGCLCGYTLSFSYETAQWDSVIPTEYFITAEEDGSYKEDFRDYAPPQKDLEKYPTEAVLPSVPQESIRPDETVKPKEPISPENSDENMSQEEFMTLFREAYDKLSPDRYEINVSSNRQMKIGGVLFANTQLKQHIKMDLTDPEAPLYYQERVAPTTASHEITRLYYQNHSLYTWAYDSDSNPKIPEKYMIMMYSDYFIEDYAVDWIFFDEKMLQDATIIKNEDGSVTASMKITGYKDELIALIGATYGDDFFDNEPLISYRFYFDYPVSITINADGTIRNFAVYAKAAVTEHRNYSQYTVSYDFLIEPIAQTDRTAIEFPHDLDTYEDITEEYYKN